MEQIEVELNEKLARWAGFKRNSVPTRNREGKYVAKWGYPDHESYTNVPDFVHSLDACFKWLVPKLDQLSITVWDNVQMYAMVYRDEHDHMGYEAEDKNKTPALALCKAIEKMIDSAYSSEVRK